MYRRELYSGQMEEMMQFDNDDDDDRVDDVPMFDYNIDSSEQMDEHMAALVLTSLSCSPASPAYMPGMYDTRLESSATFCCDLQCFFVWS